MLTEEQGCQLHQVSTATESLLKESCAQKSVPNSTRQQWRQVYGMPACDATKCPRLDTTIKAQVSKACKDGDRPLTHLQTMLLDVVGLQSHCLCGGGHFKGSSCKKRRYHPYQPGKENHQICQHSDSLSLG